MNRQDELFRQMERMAEDAFRHFDRALGQSRTWQPRADMCETPDALLVVVEVAGFSAEDLNRRISVTLTPDNRTLVVTGDRREPDGLAERVTCHQLEIIYGPFERVIPLPREVRFAREELSATYLNGFLTIRLPKRSPEEPRSIAVGGG